MSRHIYKFWLGSRWKIECYSNSIKNLGPHSLFILFIGMISLLRTWFFHLSLNANNCGMNLEFTNHPHASATDPSPKSCEEDRNDDQRKGWEWWGAPFTQLLTCPRCSASEGGRAQFTHLPLQLHGSVPEHGHTPHPFADLVLGKE